MANRIQILEWRECGDDEDSLDVRLIPDGEASIDGDSIREEYDIEPPDENEEGNGTIYINHDIEIQDGEVMTCGYRKFRVNITEITE